MTIVEEQKGHRPADDAELLFQEAKQRRRRRWLISGMTALVLIAVVGVTLGLWSSRGSHGSLQSVGLPASVASAGHSGASLSFRPVLCYAAPLNLAAGQTASTGPLPTCSPSTELTASNLRVSPNSGNINGYTMYGNMPADPQFATYPSTAPAKDSADDTVLLPGAPGEGSTRYVLGPAQVTRSAIKSASAQPIDGQWIIDLTFTPTGSRAWDSLTKQQFHQIIGVDLNGQVISAPITQPVQLSWTSFDGRVQISGAFTQRQAKMIAAEL